MDSRPADHTLSPNIISEVPELETLLPRQFKTIHNRAPVARTLKDYSFLEDDMMMTQQPVEAGSEKSQNTLTKDSGYFNSDVSDMIKRLQSDVESLRERVTSYKQEDPDSRIYETIDAKKRTSHNVSSNNGRDERVGETKETLAGSLRRHGFYRLSYMFDKTSNVFKRFLWLLLFLCCLGLLGFNVRDRLLLFFIYPINLDIQVQAVDSLEYPDITICNLNTYRLTKTVSLGIYGTIQMAESEPFKRVPLNVDYIKKHGYISYDKFLRNVSHEKQDFIHSCVWRGRRCELSDFREVITDRGLCYRFSERGAGKQIVTTEGDSGLSLVLNVEQYEYLLGPRSAVGVTVFVNDPGAHHLTHDNGVNAAVGSFTTLSLSKLKHYELSQPYGNCQASSGYSRAVCLAECQTTYLLRVCGCYMPHYTKQTDQYRPCNVKDYFGCAFNATRFSDATYPTCDCSEPCERVTYDIKLSTAATSVYAAESFMRTVKNLARMEERFRFARDTYHRVDEVIFTYDTQALASVTGGLSSADTNVSTFVNSLTVYDQMYDGKLKELFKAVENLNTTIGRFHDSFEKKTHTAFIALSLTLTNTIQTIIAEAGLSRVEFEKKTEQGINTTLGEIIRKLDRLIVYTYYGKEFYTTSVFKEMTDGIDDFDEKLLKGYGQLYREFRDNKIFYTNILKKIKLITVDITRKLNATKVIAVKLLEKSPLKSNSVYESLLEISRNTKRIMDVGVNNVKRELNQLLTKYDSHVHEILQLRVMLVNIGPNFKKTVETIKALLNSTQTIAGSLRGKIGKLKDEIDAIRTMYIMDEKFGKSVLIKKITSKSINEKLANLRLEITQFKNMVETIKLTGDQLAKSVVPIKMRLVDFKFIKAQDMESLFEWLRFPTVQRESTLLLLTIEKTTRSIGQFQTDLIDYNSGNTISSEFYQNNFLQIEVAFQDLSVTSLKQHVSYGIFDLACDIGGIMALFLGASILTCIELLFFFGHLCGLKNDRTPGYERRLGAVLNVDLPRQ